MTNFTFFNDSGKTASDSFLFGYSDLYRFRCRSLSLSVPFPPISAKSLLPQLNQPCYEISKVENLAQFSYSLECESYIYISYLLFRCNANVNMSRTIEHHGKQTILRPCPLQRMNSDAYVITYQGICNIRRNFLRKIYARLL